MRVNECWNAVSIVAKPSGKIKRHNGARVFPRLPQTRYTVHSAELTLIRKKRRNKRKIKVLNPSWKRRGGEYIPWDYIQVYDIWYRGYCVLIVRGLHDHLSGIKIALSTATLILRALSIIFAIGNRFVRSQSRLSALPKFEISFCRTSDSQLNRTDFVNFSSRTTKNVLSLPPSPFLPSHIAYFSIRL